jgi:RNA polymerase sigma factor (sigma-70 family)
MRPAAAARREQPNSHRQRDRPEQNPSNRVHVNPFAPDAVLGSQLSRNDQNESEGPVRREYLDVEPASGDVGLRLSQGDPYALEEAYRSLAPLIASYLRRYVPAPDVDDVMQRVFLEVWRVRDRFDPDKSLRAWVLAIARKRAIDQLRKRRDVVVPLDAMREIAGDDGDATADRFAWADDVRQALALLPELQRDVIRLAYFDGYTQSEIAAALDIPLGTVKTRTARGLQRLAGLLENPRETR